MTDPERKPNIPPKEEEYTLDDGELQTDPKALEYYKERAAEAEEFANYRDARPFWKKFDK